MQIRVEENPAAVVADMLVEAGERGSQIVLTGGSTPKLAYETAARADVDWGSATIWFSDERCVGPEDGLSIGQPAPTVEGHIETIVEEFLREDRAAVSDTN